MLQVAGHVGTAVRFSTSATEQRHVLGVAVHGADVVEVPSGEALGAEARRRERFETLTLH